MMTSRATLILLAALATTAIATPAQAALVHFTLTSGTVKGTFTIDSAAKPTVYSLGKYADYHGVEIYFNKFPARPYEVTFFSTASGGGIGIAAPGGYDKSNFGGLQVFAGLVTAPKFTNGTYTLTRVPSGAHATLVISGAPVALFAAALSPVPLPPGFPLFATAIAGLGFLGARKRSALA